MFYRALAQAVPLFGSETWVLLAEMEHKVEVTHMCFIWKITGKQMRRIDDRTWEMTGA